ncbi:MAG TPA: alpha-mannosidase, partial [Sphingobacterium sp.]|nr:alpha-mannosidase [Sphingobacterium sp.]
MKKSLSVFLGSLLSLGLFYAKPVLAQKFRGQQLEAVDLVNPLMGTESKFELSNGNTYPSIARPWGMNMWTPQTGKNGDGWQYQYTADKIRGLKQTHQPSPWMNDYGVFSIMPVTGKPVFDQDERASWFSHKAEIVKPYYYSVYLADHDVTAEMTPTERAAMFRISFNKTDDAYIVLDAYEKGSEVQIIPEKNMIIGYSSKYARGPLPANFKNYFVLVFDQPFASVATWEGKEKKDGQLQIKGDHTGAIVGFKVKDKTKPVQVKVASSFISAEQALLNLNELGNKSFDQIKEDGRQIWNSTLGKIKVEGDDIDQLRTFYSTMYRTLFFPNKLYEIDAQGKAVHYSPYNGKTLPGYLFGGTGFWDTFRALYPFLNFMYPSINKEMQEGLLNAYLEGGFLPEWSSPGYADIMVGNNSASVVSDAYMKGLRGYDINKLYEALQHGANNEGPMSAVGRKGVEYYNSLGYVPYD